MSKWRFCSKLAWHELGISSKLTEFPAFFFVQVMRGLFFSRWWFQTSPRSFRLRNCECFAKTSALNLFLFIIYIYIYNFGWIMPGGPIPATNGVITPTDRGYNPAYPFIWPFMRELCSIFTTRGPPCAHCGGKFSVVETHRDIIPPKWVGRLFWS